MAMKLFKKKPEVIEEDTFTKLDRLMSEMASDEIYIEYLRQRERAQLERAAPQNTTFVKHLRCDVNHPGILGMDLILSVLSGIVGTTTKGNNSH